MTGSEEQWRGSSNIRKWVPRHADFIVALALSTEEWVHIGRQYLNTPPQVVWLELGMLANSGKLVCLLESFNQILHGCKRFLQKSAISERHRSRTGYPRLNNKDSQLLTHEVPGLGRLCQKTWWLRPKLCLEVRVGVKQGRARTPSRAIVVPHAPHQAGDLVFAQLLG